MSVAEDRVGSVGDVSVLGKQLQKDLQGLYLKLKKADKGGRSGANSPQKRLMTSMEVYNRKLSELYRSAEKNKVFTRAEWEGLGSLLEKVRVNTSLKAASSDDVLLMRVRSWLSDARSFGSQSEKYAKRTSTHGSPRQKVRGEQPRAVMAHIGGVMHGGNGMVVEDFSLGLNTRQDRIDFVERLTRMRAAENRILSRGYTTPGGYPRNYPAAYIYGNGSFGNRSGLGRRDSLVPIYNRQRRPVRRVAPRVNIIVR